MTWPDCEIYPGCKNPDGYGSRGLKIDGKWKIMGAHRAAWIEAFGPVPDGLSVLHHCDNPPCVNLLHLYLGTHQKNMDDAQARRRWPNQQKTHCKHGHEFTEANTYLKVRKGKVHRYCRKCAVRASTEYKARKAAKV